MLAAHACQTIKQTSNIQAMPEFDREELLRLQQEVAQVDPAVMELDLDDPDSMTVLFLTSSILKGAPLVVKRVREDGEVESVTVQATDIGNNEFCVDFSVKSSDGEFSADTTDLFVDVATQNIDSEIDGLLGQS